MFRKPLTQRIYKILFFTMKKLFKQGIRLIFTTLILSLSFQIYSNPVTSNRDLSKAVQNAVEELLESCDDCDAKRIAILPVSRVGKKSGNIALEVESIIKNTVFEDGKLTIVERSLLKRILEEQQLQQSGLVDTKNAMQLGKLAGAQLILSSRLESGIADFRIIRIETSEVLSYRFVKFEENEKIILPQTDRENPSSDSDIPPFPDQPVDSAEIQTGWLNGKDYQTYFDAKLRMGYYPIDVKGRNQNGVSQYFGIYRKNTKRQTYYTHHGISQNRFQKRNAILKSEGYNLVHVQSFRDSAGNLRYQAIWYKD